MGKERKSKTLDFLPQCYTLTLDVYPPVAMGKDNALKLATGLSNHLDLTDIHMADETWTFRRPQVKGHSRGHIEVKVEDQEITIEHQSPSGGLERFEVLVEKTVEAVGAATQTQIIFGTLVTLEYTVEIGGDARKAILGQLGMAGDSDETGKLDVFKRPCHYVGLRLGFPPFKVEDDMDESEGEGDEGSNEEGVGDESGEHGTEGADWQVMVTFQSLQDDPEGLSVEVSGRWMGPLKWDDSQECLLHRIRTVDEFLKKRTTDFLQQFRSEE